jgi:hypothetical protein
MGYLYVGEAAGARILRYGIGVTQVGDAYALDVQTWDIRPAGDVGDAVFRTIDILLRHKAGYSIQVTPVVDGVPLQPQNFGGGAPLATEPEEVRAIQAYVGRRGNSLAVRIRTLSLLGETEIVDVSWSGAVVRETP